MFLRMKQFLQSNRVLAFFYRIFIFYKSKKNDIVRECHLLYQDRTDVERTQIMKDMMYWYLRRGISPKQYWEQRFDCLSKNAKLSMLPQRELAIFDRQYNPKKDIHIIGNKYECYERFKEYYGRECVLVNDKTPKEEFVSFVNKHGRIIIKPLYNDSGKGVRLYNYGEELPSYAFIAEELIQQREELARFHPQSVNTLRLNTIRCKDSIEVVWAILRYGRNNNIVDNAHFGGLFSVIDDNGVAIAAGDVKRHTYETHPDTGVPLTGFKVPDWEKACEMVRSLATEVGDLRFIGWDLAYTDKGWILVEANTSPGILSPMVTGQGVRKEFRSIKRRM